MGHAWAVVSISGSAICNLLTTPPSESTSPAAPRPITIRYRSLCNRTSTALRFRSSALHIPKLKPPKQSPPSSSQNPTTSTEQDDDEKRRREEEEDEAREAVSEVLRETGVSMEDATRISSTCPGYLNMLLNSVREIDELSLWSSWTQSETINEQLDQGGEKDPARFGLREKVYHMAKRKGDRGILPFLESIGLQSHSSSTRIAGYLASQPLPLLITKVNFIKEILLQSGGYEGAQIGKIARRMMMQLSIPTDDDIQQTLSFFEKMEARRGGLDMLGSVDAGLPCLVESFPQLLLRSLEGQLKPLFEFLVSVGIQTYDIKSVILLFPPILFYDIEDDIKPKMRSLQKLGIQEKEFGKRLSKYPWILSRSIQENYDEITAYFQSEKVSKSCVDRAIKSWPHLLGASVDKMMNMVVQFGDLGIRNRKLGPVISRSPQLLLRKQSEFLKVVNFLEELGLDHNAIGQILGCCPEVFASDVEKTLKKKVRLLIDFGIPSWRIGKVIKKYPEVLVSNVQDNLLPRMIYLMKMGLSKREVCSMVSRFSPLLGYSVEKVLMPKLTFLIESMERPLKEVVEYPRYFSYSLEKKIKPRYFILKGRNMHSISLEDMFGKNDAEFAEDYMDFERMLVPPPTTTTAREGPLEGG